MFSSRIKNISQRKKVKKRKRQNKHRYSRKKERKNKGKNSNDYTETNFRDVVNMGVSLNEYVRLCCAKHQPQLTLHISLKC
jgi:hypothetical protein